MNANKQDLIISDIESVPLMHTGEGSLCTGMIILVPV